MDELTKVRKELKKIQTELQMFYQIGNALRTTLELEQIFFIILTAVTAHEGLGFNRAMLFLISEREKCLEGKMAIGPDTKEQAYDIWHYIEKKSVGFRDLIETYRCWRDSKKSNLHELVKTVKLPLDEKSGVVALSAMEGIIICSTQESFNDHKNDPVFKLFGSEYFACVPLMAKNEVIGVILVDNLFNKQLIKRDDLRILDMLANHAGLAIENSKLYEEMVTKSHMDHMTQTWNHGCFQELLIVELERSIKNEQYLSLIMVDIDNFKYYNDTFGHTFGDKILKDVSSILKQNSRHCDHVCRYGGEEFVVILPGANKEGACMIAERLRKAVDSYRANYENGREKRVLESITVSIGISNFPVDAKDRYDLIVKADQALYKAKRLGKNRTCINSIDTNTVNSDDELLCKKIIQS